MLDNPGLRGLDPLAEVYELLAPHAEEFFDVAPERPARQAASPAAVVHVMLPGEAAVVEPRRWPVRYLGTSGAEQSVAVLLYCQHSGRAACANFAEPAEVEPTLRHLADQTIMLSDFAVRNGASKLYGYLPRPNEATVHVPNARRRSGPVLDANIVGGYRDAGGRSEAVIRRVLEVMMSLGHRFNIRMACAGLLNDSQHNGNEEDKRGPHSALISACALRFEAGDFPVLECKLVPVAEFLDAGPAVELRLCRNLSPKPKAAFVEVYDLATGHYCVPPFELPTLDHQTIAVLLSWSDSDPDRFLEATILFATPPSQRKRFLALGRKMLCYLLEQTFPASIHPFLSGTLCFECGADGWTPMNRKQAEAARLSRAVPLLRDSNSSDAHPMGCYPHLRMPEPVSRAKGHCVGAEHFFSCSWVVDGNVHMEQRKGATQARLTLVGADPRLLSTLL
eukprot:CAMPEP_0202079008 /NCGR_PEP_ID=MMETSP0964-20121228/6246_1 /ASSEMBLY_ACC=CAM_ASM_000500 /TAXON_ID=4773 /ORGANISM="Schizochytrium aggregatum, Strain ATCC28209" /LENGTH=449 /DNA_ID=CAMNT_0048646333 /DNA_START=95 /DNA_END=1442 /DNA_ORIENTATION=+